MADVGVKSREIQAVALVICIALGVFGFELVLNTAADGSLRRAVIEAASNDAALVLVGAITYLFTLSLPPRSSPGGWFRRSDYDDDGDYGSGKGVGISCFAGPASTGEKCNQVPVKRCTLDIKATSFTDCISTTPKGAGEQLDSTRAFEAQVQTLVNQLGMSRHGQQTIAELASSVQWAIRRLLPEAEVDAFASCDVSLANSGSAGNPSIDVVLVISPAALVERLASSSGSVLPSKARLDLRKLTKAALRAVINELVLSRRFKFRRSAFSSSEPKVTFVTSQQGRPTGQASLEHNECEKGLPFDLWINAVSPIRTAALLGECSRVDRRAKDLVLVVHRWARDRGISHVGKGYLSRYAWTLAVVCFLQAADTERESFLPALDSLSLRSAVQPPRQLPLNSRTTVVSSTPSPWLHVTPNGGRSAFSQYSSETKSKSIASLFQEFVCFYNETFDWEGGVIAVRLADADAHMHMQMKLQRQSVSAFAESATAVGNTGHEFVGPRIEDPFEPALNVNEHMTVSSFEHIKLEFDRVAKLISSCASLSEVMQPWLSPC
eukprot:TRINITY_DN5171_c0_g2_i1.p1 TRINITY_DN5171_c0_g2~~TRINITY_DN5171_c0_g2_i1.p1  ORF type:complete len:551 (+),score=63.67 TRINITY_DN5171_c0_g2_i1:35-1687(+)